MAAAEVEVEDPVAHLNELFSKRYTEEDEDYMKTVKKSQIPPPVITDWLTAGYRDRYESFCVRTLTNTCLGLRVLISRNPNSNLVAPSILSEYDPILFN